VSVPASVLISSRSFAASGVENATVGTSPLTFDATVLSADAIVSSPLVPLTTTRSAAPSPVAPPRVPARSTSRRDVGSGQVVDGDEVGAAEGVEVDQLDAGVSIVIVALSAEELEAVSVRRQVDVLGAGGAVEDHRVGAVLAFDGVAAVAGIPDEVSSPLPIERTVVASVSVDRVVAVAAEQRLVAGAAGRLSSRCRRSASLLRASDQSVVSVSTVDRRRDGVAEDAVASSMRTESSPFPGLTTISAISLAGS
jgi:hypothetical protein